MTPEERDRFDGFVAEEIDRLPDRFAVVLDELHIIVLDEPDDGMLAEFGLTRDQADELCGLHTGTAYTDRSIEDEVLPTQIHLFRRGILATAEGWDPADAHRRVRQEIRITLLHEIGHQMGLEEDDLDELGYA
ncbi:MAG: metallopeptidase family protein [Phycisphaerales bacterium]